MILFLIADFLRETFFNQFPVTYASIPASHMGEYVGNREQCNESF